MNRYYNSPLGRFMSPDPYKSSIDFRTPMSLNRYVYTNGDPINNNDPSGLCTIDGIEYPDGQPPCPNVTSVTVNGDEGSSATPMAGYGGVSDFGLDDLQFYGGLQSEVLLLSPTPKPSQIALDNKRCHDEVAAAFQKVRDDMVSVWTEFWSPPSNVETGGSKGGLFGAFEGYAGEYLPELTGLEGAVFGTVVGAVIGASAAVVTSPH
jgi:hypothetical protein